MRVFNWLLEFFFFDLEVHCLFPPSFQQLHSLWKKRFGEEVDEDLIYVVAVERVLQLEDFKEVSWCFMLSCFDSWDCLYSSLFCSLLTLSVYLKITIIWNILNMLIKMWFWCLKLFQDGVWVTSLDYKNSYPDPLRDFAEKLVNEINTNNMEDVNRFCNIYVDLDFQVCTQLNVFCLYFYLKFVRNSNLNVT